MTRTDLEGIAAGVSENLSMIASMILSDADELAESNGKEEATADDFKATVAKLKDMAGRARGDVSEDCEFYNKCIKEGFTNG